jgi:hypothetical protein
MNRERIEDSIFVTLEDVQVGFMLYASVSEANELGLSPELYAVHQKLKPHIENFENGITRKDFQKLYFQEFHKVIGQELTINILKIWASVGIVIEQPDPDNRRQLRYICHDMGECTQEKNMKEADSTQENISNYSLCIPPPQTTCIKNPKTSPTNNPRTEEPS